MIGKYSLFLTCSPNLKIWRNWSFFGQFQSETKAPKLRNFYFDSPTPGKILEESLKNLLNTLHEWAPNLEVFRSIYAVKLNDKVEIKHKNLLELYLPECGFKLGLVIDCPQLQKLDIRGI